MSLLDVMKEKFNVMDKVTEPDGMGGFMSVYREGAEFEAVVEITNSISEETAKAQGVSGVYDEVSMKGGNLCPANLQAL